MMTNIDNAAVGERIRRKRCELGLTQEQLAQRCSISTSYIGHLERGTGSMSVNILVLISKALGVSTDYILLDCASDEDQTINHIAAAIREKPPEKKRIFFTAVRALADRIDEF